MTTMNAEVYDALVNAGADETKAREAAISVAQYDRDVADIRESLADLKTSVADIRESLADLKTSVADIRGSLRIMQWMFGFTLAFVVALTWQVFASQ